HFKKINDHFGHHSGDQVLATIATLLRKHMPDIAMIARWGGEEFIIALHSYPLQHIEQQAKRLCQQIALHPFAHGEPVTVSIGIIANHAAESLSSALNRADQAMYRAKQQGRNQVVSCPILA
ncbi:MAG: GGDEF domain-containing protein, partial [Plesiomonas sp.]